MTVSSCSNLALAAVTSWTYTEYPNALMCYRDLKVEGPKINMRGPTDGSTFVQPNQIVIADSIPECYLNELATVINNCYHTVDNIETCRVREISNVLHRIRSQSVDISQADKPKLLIYPLYQTPQTQEMIR